MNATQTPQQEYQERAAEQASAWITVPQLAALQNLRQLWADARGRVFDSHKAQMGAIGGEATEPDEMGDIGISGDHTTTINNHYHGQPSGMGALVKKAIPLVLAATCGLGAAWAWNYFCNKPTTPVVQPASPQDWKLGVVVE